MFSINIKYSIVTGIVLCELLGWQAAEARINGQYFYELTAEDHSDAPNEVYSTLGLEIGDNIISSKAPTEYGLETRWTYDRENNVTNEQYSGFLTGEYIFIQSSLWWNYFGEVDVIPVDRGIEIDSLRSQNLSTVSTGPTISLWKNLRGSINLTALASITNYSESNLDSRGEDITLNYFYPYSEIMSMTYSLDYEKVSYDDVSNATDDYDLLTAGITINRNTVYSNFQLILEHGELENNNKSSSENMFELTMGYQINAFSNISMEISDSLISSTDFNRLEGNPDNAIFTTGLVRNERFQLGYEHITTDTSYGFRVFTNQLENIFDTVVTSGNINGAIIDFSHDINDEISLFIGLESTDDEFLNRRSKELITTATYTRRHSERLFSQLALTVENDRVNDVDSTDTSILYRITSKLF